MMKSVMQCAGRLLSAALLLAAAALPAAAQDSSDEWLERCRRQDARPTHCEVREATLPATAELSVDARPNGGVQVSGWEREQVLVRARLQARAGSQAEARELAARVDIETEPGRVHARGPRDLARGQSWSVSYEVFVPRRTSLALGSQNGGLSVSGVQGRMRLSTTNGGVSLAGVGGDVRGETVNGGISVQLDGSRWAGEGLDLRTTNGGVSLSLPADYSAELRASTVNGGVSSDLPTTRRGVTGGTVETRLGGGGSPIRIVTTNGAIRIRRR